MSDPIWPEFELVRDFMPVLVTSKFDEYPIKNDELAWRHHFLIISMGHFLDAQVHLTLKRELSDLAEI